MSPLPITSQPTADAIPSQLAGLTENNIRDLVLHFYGRIQKDPMLAPIFAGKISRDAWPRHLDRMTDFWSSVLLRSGRYRGNPTARHAALPELSPHHFERWLELFASTTHDLFDADQAEHISELARNMGQGLQRAIGLSAASRPGPIFPAQGPSIRSRVKS